MMRRWEKPRSPAVAGEQQRPGEFAGAPTHGPLEQGLELLVSGRGITNVEPDGLSHVDLVSYGDGSSLWVRSHDAPDEEVAPAMLQFVLVDDPAKVQAPGNQLPL